MPRPVGSTARRRRLGVEIYAGLETEASTLRAYESQLVHGLLQTRDYARAVLRAHDRQASAERIDRRADLRMKRQDVLTRSDSPLDLWVILDEAVLRRPVGGPKIMRSQLGKLIEASEMPNLTLQVLQFSQGAHAAMNGPFYILEFAGNDPGMAYIETAGGNVYLEKDHEMRRWAEVFDQLRAEAMSPAASRDMISNLSAEI